MRFLLFFFVAVAFSLSDLPERLRHGSLWKEHLLKSSQFRSTSSSTGITSGTLDQLIDHFGGNGATFKQRYYIDTSNWKNAGSPVFLYISGEGPMDTYPTGSWTEYAYKMGAAVITLEHRFYGKSIPFGTYSNSALEYLIVEQALADLVSFLDFFRQQTSCTGRAIIVGGSYSGALSSWFKSTYPDSVVGAWSSSGVVNAIFDFYEFDLQVGYSAGEDCANLMRKATADAEARYPAVKSLYGAEDLDQADFFYMVADGNAMAVQYGKRTDICSALSAAASAGDPLPEAQAKFLLDLWGPNFGTSCFYSTQCLQFNNTQDRSWRWQTCRQLAYFQGAPTPSEGSTIRSKVVTVQYQVDQCKQVFGGVYPNTTIINDKFGGAYPTADNVYYLDASDDPWQRASVNQSIGSSLYSYINCTDCGHCIDLHHTSPNDPPQLTKVRNSIQDFLSYLLYG